MVAGIKYEYSEVKDILKSIGFELISKEYINSNSKIVIKDIEGYLYESSFSNIRIGHIQKRFSKNNPYTIKNIKNWADKNNIYFGLIDYNYVNMNKRMNFKCECGKNTTKTLRKFIEHKGARCDECAEKLRRDNHSYSPQKIESVLNSYGFYILEYPDVLRTETKVTCVDKDGYKYYITQKQVQWQTPQTFSTYNPYTIENIKHYIKINDIDAQLLSEDYKGNLEYMDFKCGCGRTYQTNLQRFRKENAVRCQVCSGYQSTIAYLTEQWLIDNKFDYEAEVTFDDINNKKYGKLRFDFKVGNILIEVDGIQHFEPVKHWGGSEGLKQQIKRDLIKNEYCKQNGIKLIRIPYFEYKYNNHINILNRELIENNPSKE
jgi:hypothetical protein